MKPLTTRFLLVIAYIATLAVFFWTTSRYPALGEKAIMEASTTTKSIGFDEWIEIDENLPWYTLIIYNTANWAFTNKQGMTFGLLFAVGIMLLFSLLKHKEFKNRFLNTVVGMLFGAPLGVCVNCAAPIAQGMRKGGASVETSLSAMISSPTLNVVVLGMLVSLFPWYMVTIKLALTVLFILVGIPLIGKYLSPIHQLNYAAIGDMDSKSYSTKFAAIETDLPSDEETIGGSFKWFFRSLLKNGWYIIKVTVPLMLLAGFLGNVLITLFPWDAITAMLPQNANLLSIQVLLAIVILGLIGIFLPVPIAFDIIICAVLLVAGVPQYFVMVLLFTLGIYSIYSFFIVRQAMSMKIALASTFILVGLGIIGGLVVKPIESWNTKREIQLLAHVLREDVQGPETLIIDERTAPLHLEEIKRRVKTVTPTSIHSTQADQNIRVHSTPYYQDDAAADEFKRVSGPELGLGMKHTYSPLLLIEGKGTCSHAIAAGDIHGDGWQDLALVSSGLLHLFANTGGRFVSQAVPALPYDNLVSIAMADINNDLWLDLVCSTEGNGNFYLPNDSGDFAQAQPIPIPNAPEAWLTRPMAFADYDRDHDLDIFWGNFSVSKYQYNWNRNKPKSNDIAARNALVVNENGQFRVQLLPTGIIGETLCSIWTDLDNDGWVDLIEGNDFMPPDVFYRNANGDYPQPITRADAWIQATTRTTMSYITGDLNNDLQPELYIAQIALMGLKDHELRHPQDRVLTCAELDDPEERAVCERLIHLRDIQHQLKDQKLQLDGISKADIEFLMLEYNLTATSFDCNDIPEKWSWMKQLCNKIRQDTYQEFSKQELKDAVPFLPSGNNVLLAKDEHGKFMNVASQWGVATGGYSWNAKFADLNADEYLDLYIVTGSHFNNTRQANFLYLNQQGKRFENKIDQYSSLNSFLATQAYAYIDLDNDGDQDIITAPAMGPLRVHLNNMKKGNALSFEIKDHQGNRFGIGSKVTIHYGPNGEKHQVREMLASGGHLSFDPYILYFGLGEATEVNKIEIAWSTGEKTELQGPFPSGAKYTIERKTPEQPQ